MIKDNGLDSRDPDYDDYGYSDFLDEYEPDEETLITWLSEIPEHFIIWMKQSYHYSDYVQEWKNDHEDEIEDEWNSKGEE